MNAKIRALVWEEMRTSGALAGLCTVLAVSSLYGLRMYEGAKVSWHYVEMSAMPMSLGPALALAVGLLLRTGNSGHLTSGFSERLLLLPVETRQLAATILITRSLLMAVATGVMILACHLIFGAGPAWQLTLILTSLYLSLQTVDWLYRAAPLLSLACSAWLVVIAAGALIYSKTDPGNLDRLDMPWYAALSLLGLVSAVAFTAAVYSVGRIRRSDQPKLALSWHESTIGLPRVWFIPARFQSARWALLWRFLNQSGIFLPLFLVGCGITACIALLAVYFYTLDLSRVTAPAASIFEWMSLALFTLVAGLWGAFSGTAPGLRPATKGGHRGKSDYLYPVASADLCATLLLGRGIAIVGCWLCVVAISNAAFLLSDGALAWRILGMSWDAGEVSARELARIFIYVPTVCLLIAWAGTAATTRLFVWNFIQCLALGGLALTAYMMRMDAFTSEVEVLLMALAATPILALAGAAEWLRRIRRGGGSLLRHGSLVLLLCGLAAGYGFWSWEQSVLHLLWLPGMLLVASVAGAFVWAWKRGLVPPAHLAGFVGIWLFVAVVAYPSSLPLISVAKAHAFLAAFCAGALAVLPYPALLLDIHRQRHEDDTALDKENGSTSWNLSHSVRFSLVCCVIAVVVFAAWLRWPTRPAYVQVLRDRGLPATPGDLARQYSPYPIEENSAPTLLSIMRLHDEREKDWDAWLDARRAEADESEAERLYGDDSPVVYGTLDAAPDETVSVETWEKALKRRETVNRPISEALANSGFEAYPMCRFPVPVDISYTIALSHLQGLRDLARAEAFSGTMAAIEDRPADALAHIRNTGALSNAIQEEPMLISQLVRIALLGVMQDSVKQAINRTEFTPAQLADLQDFVGELLPPMEVRSIFETAVSGERVFLTSGTAIAPEEVFPFEEVAINTEWLIPQFSRLVTLRGLDEWNANLQSAGRNRMGLLHEIESHTGFRYFLVAQSLSSFSHTIHTEFRVRVALELAATACAVERYRLEHSTLPETLHAMVPAFLEGVSGDPFRDDDGPISYRVQEDGGYVLYSWSLNGTDEGGLPLEEGNEWIDGDITFRVAPSAFRNGPQIATDSIGPQSSDIRHGNAAAPSQIASQFPPERGTEVYSEYKHAGKHP